MDDTNGFNHVAQVTRDKTARLTPQFPSMRAEIEQTQFQLCEALQKKEEIKSMIPGEQEAITVAALKVKKLKKQLADAFKEKERAAKEAKMSFKMIEPIRRKIHEVELHLSLIHI